MTLTAFTRRRGLSLGALLVAGALASGCATPSTPYTANPDAPTDLWAGRISLQIQSEPLQAFFAGFELKGNAKAGELKLTSPIGSTVGVMRWSPDEAVLVSSNETRRFASVDALITQTTGAAIPLAALFDWLAGKDTSLNGWTADLSQQPDGKISARRTTPAPQTDLRVILEK